MFAGLPCDLTTGEDRRFAPGADGPAAHLSATVEMLSLDMHVELAIIDEIQMIRDPGRGFSFTRALLGAAANEVHLCGEEASIDILHKLIEPIGEKMEVRRYKRKASLIASTHGLRNFNNLEVWY